MVTSGVLDKKGSGHVREDSEIFIEVQTERETPTGLLPVSWAQHRGRGSVCFTDEEMESQTGEEVYPKSRSHRAGTQAPSSRPSVFSSV